MSDPGKITAARLKDLGLYTAFDISKWCTAHGIESVYLEHVRVKLNRQEFKNQQLLDRGYWAVRDSKVPGKNLLKIIPRGKRPHVNARAIGMAWIEANYNTPTTWVTALRTCLPTPAVKLLEDELRLMHKVWSPILEEREEVPVEIRSKFLQTYPHQPRSIPAASKDLVFSWQ